MCMKKTNHKVLGWFIILVEAVMHRLWRAFGGRHHPDLHLNSLSETCCWRGVQTPTAQAYRWAVEDSPMHYRLAWVYLCPRGERSSRRRASWTPMCWDLPTSSCWMRFQMTLLSELFSLLACSHPGLLGGCFSPRKSNKTVRCFWVLWCKWMFVYLREGGRHLQGFSCRSQPTAAPPWRWDVHS